VFAVTFARLAATVLLRRCRRWSARRSIR